MGTGDPIRQLREVLSRKPLFSERNGYAPLDREPLLELLDEIETKYIRLPVDHDGVPWHIGDIIENGKQELTGMFLNRHGWSFSGVRNAIDPSVHRHARPENVENIISAAMNLAWLDTAEALTHGDTSTLGDAPYDEQCIQVKVFASRIRKAFEIGSNAG